MPHSSALRNEDVQKILEDATRTMLTALLRAEEAYQDLLEAYQYAGGTDDAFAQLIFNTATPTTEQQAIAGDYIAAAQELHARYNTANLGALRRVS